MKKVMMLAALLAMLVVAAVPAIAQVTQDFDQDAESGDVDQSFTITSEGSNGNQCVNANGVANTGNAQTQNGMIQYASDIEEIEQEDIGNTLSVTGNSSTECEQEVNQAAAAGGGSKK
ncbi:MAG: hypothetical protein M3122_02695 [Actinomycetota bacterium]|nr:hypothetical protein [Actinomycetota bacterium]